MSDWSAVSLIARVVRGEERSWPGPAGAVTGPAFLDAARRHGLHLVVAALLREAGVMDDWPPEVARGLSDDLLAASLLEQVRREEIRRVLASLSGAGLPALVFKGVALAYTCYPSPWLRPSVDTDVLVRDGDRGAAARALEAAGYRRAGLVDGSLVMRQAEYERAGPGGVRHVVDLHWRLANPEPFAGLLTFDELAEAAMPVPPIGGRAPGPAHHLLIACTHRVAHHVRSPRLVWRYDVHLLAASMDADALDRFVRLARDRAMSAVSAHELAAARDLFGTRPAVSIDELCARLGPAAPEPSAAFLSLPGSRATRLLIEVRWQPGWRSKFRLVGQHLFPSPAYMRAAYRGSRPAWLPAQYAHRILRGIGRWLRREPV